MTGCDKTTAGIKEGKGWFTYDGVRHELGVSTLATTDLENGRYDHVIYFLDATGSTVDYFVMEIDDNVSKNTIPEGTYNITVGGANTAGVSVSNGPTHILTGTMKVTRTSDSYNFNFTGQTTGEDPKAVALDYDGALNPEEKVK